jgi:5-methylcytosine-specific restriction protein A
MKLTTLKPRLQVAGQRLTTLAPARAGTVERVRGWKGVNDRKRIRARDGGMCQECKRHGRFTLGGPVDHIKPLWDGGTDEDSNKELLCQDCHDAKTVREAAQRARG